MQYAEMKLSPSLTVLRSEQRGHSNHGWLDSHFTFSFADYYEPARMGFRSLRVLNDDRIAPLGGFPSHPHRDMEIFSYVLEGQLSHEDSMGHKRILEPGQIQLMSAGKGVVHSEYNPSPQFPTHLLQIWITPAERHLEPSYTEWHPQPGTENEAKVLVISPDGRDQSATIHQDADIYRLKLAAGQSIQHDLPVGRGLWLHVAKGSGILNGTVIQAGDAVSSETAGSFEIRATDEGLEALLFDIC
jgi:quercetin 2,3-dioxygenase